MFKDSVKLFVITVYLFLTNTNPAVSRCFNCAIATSETDNTLNFFDALSSSENSNMERREFSQLSLWWAIEQFDPFGGRLVESWSSHAGIKEINLTVNLQLWTLMDYLGRYSFVNQFGTTVRNQGYNLNIFSTKKQRLATYKYNYRTEPPKWEITLERLGKDSLRVNP